MTKTVTPAGWNDPATAPKDGTMLHLLIRPGQEDLDPFTSFQDSREPYETIGFNQLSDTTVDEWQFAGWDWCHDCITDGHGEVIGWMPFGINAQPPHPKKGLPKQTLPQREADSSWAMELPASALKQGSEKSVPLPPENHVPVTADQHNAAFDPANDALGGAFKDGFREGWLFAKDPGFEEREELEKDYPREVDIAPSECWDAYRSHYFAMLPLEAIPEVGSPSPQTRAMGAPVDSQPVDNGESGE